MKTTKRSFRAARQLKLHQRAVDCLDMIVSCDKKIADAQDEINSGISKDIFGYLFYWQQQKLKYDAIKRRLTKYYAEIMSRVEDIAILHVENKVNQINNY